MWEKYKHIIILLLIHACIIMGMFALRVGLGQEYRQTVLNFDGYYDLAHSFVNGGPLTRTAHGPVLPLILSTLFLFPVSLHPFIRLLTTLLFSLGTLFILYEISKNYLSRRQFFIGSLIFIFNPIFIHWTFRGAPEIYLCFFLGLFILGILRYNASGRMKHLWYALAAFIISFFIKPVFLFIAPVLFLTGLLLIKSKRIVWVSVLLVVVSLVSYKGYKITTNVTETGTSASAVSEEEKKEEKEKGGHEDFLIMDSFWTDYVIRTGQYHKGTVLKYKVPKNRTAKYPLGGSLFDIYAATSDKWIQLYFAKHPGSGRLSMNLHFFSQEPLMVLQKLAVSPLFFFSMSARPKETYIKLLFSIFSILLAVIGLLSLRKKPEFKKEIKKDIIIIIAVLFGFAALFFLTHSMNRYSYPVLPYLSVWGGIAILKIKPLNDFLTRKKILDD